MKPGWQTTEFWVTIVVQLLALGVLTGKISAADAAGLKDSITQVIENGVALVSSAVVVWKYIQSRTEIKTTIEGGKGFILPK